MHMLTIDLSKRPRSRDELEAWYGAALEDQERSGLSVAEYASEIGVTPATLYNWRRRLCDASEGPEETPIRSGGLIQVDLEKRSAPVSAGPFVLRLDDHRSLEVPVGFDDDELERLLDVLDRC